MVAEDAALAQEAQSKMSVTESSQAPSKPDAQTAGPERPPASGPTNMSEFLDELNRVPLFMTTLDETDGGTGSNADLDALRSLAYEGTRAEIAENFRQQGNDLARVRRWGDAREFYDKALDALHGKLPQKPGAALGGGGDGGGGGSLKEKLEAPVGEREVDWLDAKPDEGESKVVDLEEEEEKMRSIEEACAVNRALCNLELKNYGQATRDCARALRLNAKNVKAYYRSALALLAVDRTSEASHAVALGLSRDPSNASLQSLQARVTARHDLLAQAEAERTAREQKARFEALVLKEALKRRGIVTAETSKGQPDMEDARVALEDASNPDSELRTPLLILYPTVGQSELVKEVRESESMGDVLGMVLPVPFEGGEEFGGPDGLAVDVFVESGGGGLKKIGKKVSWGRVLKDGGCIIRDGLCQAFVVPKTKVDGWIHEYKKRAGKG